LPHSLQPDEDSTHLNMLALLTPCLPPTLLHVFARREAVRQASKGTV